MAKKLICPKCDYENREGTLKCLICSTNLKGQKTVAASFEESSDKQSTTTSNPIEATTEAVEATTEAVEATTEAVETEEEENLKEVLEKPSGKTQGDESFGKKQRRKITPIRIIIYALLAAYWIWFGIQRCGVDENIS